MQRKVVCGGMITRAIKNLIAGVSGQSHSAVPPLVLRVANLVESRTAALGRR